LSSTRSPRRSADVRRTRRPRRADGSARKPDLGMRGTELVHALCVCKKTGVLNWYTRSACTRSLIPPALLPLCHVPRATHCPVVSAALRAGKDVTTDVDTGLCFFVVRHHACSGQMAGVQVHRAYGRVGEIYGSVPKRSRGVPSPRDADRRRSSVLILPSSLNELSISRWLTSPAL
jgi:hypothetical protein